MARRLDCQQCTPVRGGILLCASHRFVILEKGDATPLQVAELPEPPDRSTNRLRRTQQSGTGNILVYEQRIFVDLACGLVRVGSLRMG